MRLKLMAAAVSIFALAMPATAMAAGGGGGARTGGSGGAEHGATGHTFTILARGSGYGRPGGSHQVRALQRRLAAAGFGPGPIDGLYGPRTEAATDRFQAATGLAIDGIAGPRTLGALSSAVPTLYPGAGYGSDGSRLVRDLQRSLTRAGYHPGGVDGLYGPHTELAVRRLEAAHGLRADGIAHPWALAGLREQIQVRHRVRPATVPPTPASRAAKPVTRPALATAQSAQHPSGGPSRVLIALLVAGLALTLSLLGVWHARRRRAARFVSAAKVTDSTNGQVSSPPKVTDSSTGNVSETLSPDVSETLSPDVPETLSPDVREPLASASRDAVHPDNEFRLGVLLEGQNDLAGAVAAYRRADLEGHAAAASNLGVLLERRDDRAGAEAAYRRAAERGDPNGAFNLGMLLEEQDDRTGAEVAYRRGDLQGHAAAASNLGVLLERRGDLAGAEAAYRRADQRGDPNGAFNLAVLLEEHSDLAGAEAAYRRADERGPAEVANAARAALLSLRGSLSGPGAANEQGLNAR